MKLAATPATGILLSHTVQKNLSARTVVQLVDLQSAKALPADEMKELVASLPGKAGGGEARRSDLEPWLREVLKPYLAPAPDFYFGDAVYYLPTMQDMDEAWGESGLGGLISTPQRFDGDHAASAFKGHCSRVAYFREDWNLCGLCVGFVSGSFGWVAGPHAASLFVEYDDGVVGVKFLEPANGRPHSLEECREIRSVFL